MIDIAMRIISLEQAPRRTQGGEAIGRLGELGALSAELAQALAPLAGLRNVLVREYADLDRDLVYAHLGRLGALRRFADGVRRWLRGDGDAPAE